MLVDVFTAASTVTAASFVALPVPPAFAAEYVPQLKDMKQILVLGQGLDRLIVKLKDPDQIETVREVRSSRCEETKQTCRQFLFRTATIVNLCL